MKRHQRVPTLICFSLLAASLLLLFSFYTVRLLPDDEPDDETRNAILPKPLITAVPTKPDGLASPLHSPTSAAKDDGFGAAPVSGRYCNLPKEIPVDWSPSDLLPEVRDYLTRFVLIAVVTGFHDQYFRLDCMLCTYLSHVPPDNLFTITDNLNGEDGRPGVWLQGTISRKVEAAVFMQRMRNHHYTEGWVHAQFRFFDALRILYMATSTRESIRWVVTLDDDTFMNLNALVAMLHKQDLYNLFTYAVPDWNSVSRAEARRWESYCARHLLAEASQEDQQNCKNVPRTMRALVRDASVFFPFDANNTEAFAEEIGAIPLLLAREPQMEPARAAQLRALWKTSVDLFNPLWLRESILRPQYVSRLPFGGVGHYLNRALKAKFLLHYKTSCVGDYLMKRGLASDRALGECLKALRTYINPDDHLCLDGGLSNHSHCAYERAKEFMKSATIVSLHLKRVFRIPRNYTFMYLTEYYNLLYKHRLDSYDVMTQPDLVAAERRMIFDLDRAEEARQRAEDEAKRQEEEREAERMKELLEGWHKKPQRALSTSKNKKKPKN